MESWTNLLAILVDLSAWSDMADRAGLAVERFPLNPLLHYYYGLGLRESKRSALAADAYRAGRPWCWTIRCWRAPWLQPLRLPCAT